MEGRSGLAINALLILRVLTLLMGLTAFYRLWTSNYLVKKIMAWLVFQTSVVLLWLSCSYSYHGHWNPLPQVVAFLIGVFSVGIGGIMLIFALGVLRRHGSWEIENRDSEGLS
jgi:multisubunit Na+/H+ antiporter MnhC subunit